MAVPEAICQSGVRWKFGILTVYLQCSAVLDPRVWHHGILHLAAEFASMHFATGVKEQRGQGPVILCHLQFHTTLTFIFTFSWPWFKYKNSLSYYFLGEGFLNPEKLDFTSWWVSIWNLSSIHQDTEGAGKEPKAKQVKLWLWPEKRGTLATVAPNSTDNGRTEKVQHLESNIIQNLATNPYNINLGWQLWKELVTYCYCSLNKWIQCDDDVFVNFPLSWYSSICQEWFLHRSGRLVDHLATRTPYWQATLKKTFLVQ